jgi:hypothetical protein
VKLLELRIDSDSKRREMIFDSKIFGLRKRDRRGYNGDAVYTITRRQRKKNESEESERGREARCLRITNSQKICLRNTTRGLKLKRVWIMATKCCFGERGCKSRKKTNFERETSERNSN